MYLYVYGSPFVVESFIFMMAMNKSQVHPQMGAVSTWLFETVELERT